MEFSGGACMVQYSSIQCSSLLELLALVTKTSWNYQRARTHAEGQHHNKIVAAGHGSMIPRTVEQPDTVDEDDHEHALCARGL